MTTDEDRLLDFEIDCISRPIPDAEAAAARFRLALDAEDLRARLQVYGHLIARRDSDANLTDELVDHVEEFIRRAPYLSSTNVDELGPVDDGSLARIARAWAGVLISERLGTRAVENAFLFVARYRPDEVDAVLERLRIVGHDSWHAQLVMGQFHLRAGERGAKADCYRMSADEFDRALELARPPANRFEGQAALASYAAGRVERARELAAHAIEHRGFNIAINVHLGHTVIGLLALDVGDARVAELALKSSCVGAVGPSGPSFRLVNRLLAAGVVEPVKTYLEHMAEVWKQGARQCREWIAVIEAGGVPDIRNPGR